MQKTEGDPNHFQSHNQNDVYPDDPRVDMQQSLVGLLNTVGPLFTSVDEMREFLGLEVTDPMQWDVGYKCDLGFGGRKFPVGKASAIFQGDAAIDRHKLAEAAGTTLSHITQAHVDKMQNMLRGIFQLSDENWWYWRPLDRTGTAI
jgi:hypothetical protein